MKPERINEVIEEHCKITRISKQSGEILYRWKLKGIETVFRPDYYHDLNAIHEACESLNDLERIAYSHELSVIIVYGFPEDQDDLFCVIQATAAQRAEAFVKAINKWEEE